MAISNALVDSVVMGNIILSNRNSVANLVSIFDGFGLFGQLVTTCHRFNCTFFSYGWTASVGCSA
jgi:hypothetical protein